MNYSAQLSAGSLLVPESRQLAPLLLQHPDEAAWQYAIKVDNVLQKASPATAWRMARLIRQRLACLDEAGLSMVANDSLEVATQMLLLAAVRHSRLLGDYMIDVYRGRLRRLETHLNPKDWAVFVHECEQRDPSAREWVTSQEDIDAAIGEANKAKSQDFSKIQGRFHTRLSLASSNTDAVIGERLLAKTEDAHRELRDVFAAKGDIINNQLAFSSEGVTCSTT
ncbi:DUF1819 family protein [Laribacter hongkongensis]|uniref:DUF1819 family protein n=1 Tax=Laribacter hongkongensis TaxID=168471 RepID=UPI001EFD0181|nr:DUF1819 family protein [Laribacter hongkongensis]MCG9040004.1 DUF1819 family protein [Laribacter hongkongensis]MCG9068857.1 DUF1819 family protein [Laribacter hongkongensis]